MIQDVRKGSLRVSSFGPSEVGTTRVQLAINVGRDAETSIGRYEAQLYIRLVDGSDF